MYKIKCPHCGKEIEITLPEDLQLRLIDVIYGGMSVPDLVKWATENLLIDKVKRRIKGGTMRNPFRRKLNISRFEREPKPQRRLTLKELKALAK